ncbi:RNA-directed DNA polymerase, eukaryota, partial [Tanacetum coccineum]
AVESSQYEEGQFRPKLHGRHGSGINNNEGGSILALLEDMINVGKTMGFNLAGCAKDMEKIISSQGAQDETKFDKVSDSEVRSFWGNSIFEFIISDAIGNSGGLLCAWNPNIFHKEHHIISDNFIALYGTWKPNKSKMLFINVYAPQPGSLKRILWSYLSTLINRWNGECIVMGDFNEVRRKEERWGSIFDAHGSRYFNNFIDHAGLVEIQLEGFSFTWSHVSAAKMSKLDRFLVSDGVFSLFPHVSAICLDRNLSDHRPILLREVCVDYGPTPFRFYHSWFELQGFDLFITQTWEDIQLDDKNDLVRFKKKLQTLKKAIRVWVNTQKSSQSASVHELKSKLNLIDSKIDKGDVNADLLVTRMSIMKQLQETNYLESRDHFQKAKIHWAVEGDENSKFFHGIVNKKRANLAVKGVMVDGDWVDDPIRVKEEFHDYFATRFCETEPSSGYIDFNFPNKISGDQLADIESPISNDEIRRAVWGCGENKSPGPDGFSFEFFRKFWHVVGNDLCAAVTWFSEHYYFPSGCNSSFIALIPKCLDPKTVGDYRPICLIGSIYKVVTKILANRLSLVISDLVSEVQTAFLPNRQILDGPFIITELLARCRHKKQKAMVFKVDFAKAYDSVRWDYLEAVLISFGFGAKWVAWIRGCLLSSKASVLVNGSPTKEFQFFRGLKQGDPLAPFLFILVMESLHLSFSRLIDAGMFVGIKLDSTTTLSHLFYADDAIFIGEWSQSNLSCILNMLHCFSLISGLSLNLSKCQLLGVGLSDVIVSEAASQIGCSIMHTPFKYLGVSVGGNMNLISSWDDVVNKLKSRLSTWKLKTLSIGGRLTLIKSVLGSTPIYNMSIYKVPKAVLCVMESIRRNFFNGIREGERKIAWVKWSKVLAPKSQGGLGVSSYYALNRGLLAKWIWRFISRDNSLWYRVIHAIHGPSMDDISVTYPSLWKSIIREMDTLKHQGMDFISHCKLRVGNGTSTRFWKDMWLGNSRLCMEYPRLFALENDKECKVATKLHGPFESSFRRNVRGGIESSQLSHILGDLESVVIRYAMT